MYRLCLKFMCLGKLRYVPPVFEVYVPGQTALCLKFMCLGKLRYVPPVFEVGCTEIDIELYIDYKLYQNNLSCANLD